MKLIKEFANSGRENTQTFLRKADGSDAGANDTGDVKNDVRFTMMRNIINSDRNVQGGDVQDYLERAHELNDEVDTVAFGLETDDDEVIKVYVNADQADEFEAEMSKLLGLEDDIESAVNTLAQKFDIVDVVWPKDPSDGAEDEDNVNIDDDIDLGGPDEEETTAETDDKIGDEDQDKDEGISDESDDLAAEEDADTSGEVSDKAALEDDEEFELDSNGEPIPKMDDEGNPVLDADGNPVMRKKKKKAEADDETTGEDDMTKEGLSALSKLAAAKRQPVVTETAKPVVKEPEAYVGEQGSLGSSFLSRVMEAEEAESGAKEAPSSGDTVMNGLRSRLKKPYEKKVVDLFSALGILGRYLDDIDAVGKSIQTHADKLRGAGRVSKAFNAFVGALSGSVAEGVEIAEAKKGSATMKRLETILIGLGLPSATAEDGTIGTILRRAATRVDKNGEAKTAMNNLARAMGISVADVNEAQEIDEAMPATNDAYISAAIEMMLALGLPQANIDFRSGQTLQALRAQRQKLQSPGTIANRLEKLVSVIKTGERRVAATEPTQTTESFSILKSSIQLNEAFGELEALTTADLDQYQILEPANGPAMYAPYQGSGKHEETVLIVGVDPEAIDDRKSLRVGVDSPWDGTIHKKFFENNIDGYKAALQYANQLRTANLRIGGRPKGWQD